MSSNVPTYEVPLSVGAGGTTSAWYRWFQGLNGGFTGIVTTAKLTGGGANGSITFRNGIVVLVTPAT